MDYRPGLGGTPECDGEGGEEEVGEGLVLENSRSWILGFDDNILGFDDDVLGFDDSVSEFDDNIGIYCFIQHEASLERGSPKSFPLRFHLGNMMMRMRMIMIIMTR